MKELIKDVEQWVVSVGIKDKATTFIQWQKMQEEVEELFVELEKCDNESCDTDKAEMELGDVVVTCIAMSMLIDTDIESVLKMAYDKISKRTGKMINGTFYKSEDIDKDGKPKR